MTETIIPDGTPPEPSGDSFTAEQWTTKFNEGAWVENLPSEIADSPSLAKFVGKPHSEVVKSYINLEKGFGDKIPRGRETFTQAEWDTYNKEYTPGFPETPEEYKLQTPEGAPTDYTITDEEFTKFKNRAHKLGMSQAQTERFWNQEQKEKIDTYNTNVQQMTEQIKTDETFLKKEWGAAYPERLNIVNAVAQKFAPPELMEQIGNNYVNSAVKIMLYNIGKNFKEGTIERQGTPSGVPSPAEAKIKANESQKKSMEAFQKGDKISGKKHHEEASKWFKLAYPESK